MKRNTLFSLACVLPIGLYALTASRTLPWGDGAEFYIAVQNLGIPHPSGYPLFLLLGRITYMVSNAPFLLNVLPGVIAACATFFLYRIILHLTNAPVIGLALALIFTTGREVWQQSVAAEIYTVNVCLFTLLLYCVLMARTNARFSMLAFFVAGLALTDHLTAVFYIVPCIICLIGYRPSDARYAPIMLIPLFLYLYFPLRSHADPMPDLFNPETVGGLVTYVSGKAFLYRIFSLARGSLFPDVLAFIKSWWYQFLILLPLGFYGFFRINSKHLRIVLGCVCVFVLGYTLLYDIPDKQGYYLPFYAVWAVVTAVAIAHIVPVKLRPVLFVFPLINIAVNYRTCDLSRETSLHDLGTAMMAMLPDSSLFFSDDYFVHYEMIEQARSSSKSIIPVNQFYLRMKWYINMITERYPDLIVPGAVTQLLVSCDEALEDASPMQYGEISKRCCLAVQYEIVQANLSTRPVCYFMYDDNHWPQRMYELYLQYHGLYYRFQRDSLWPRVFDLHVPPPDRYQVDQLVHEDAIYFAKKIAAAYNRRGIDYSLNNDFQDAIHDLNMALQYYPDYYQVYANLGIIYLAGNDTALAMDAWETYLDKVPHGPQRERIEAWLDAIR